MPYDGGVIDRGPRRPAQAWVILALAGCGFSPSGATTGATDAVVDAPCAAGCSAAGDEAITCDPDGHPVRLACPYGCIDQPGTPVCARTLIPANVDPDTLTTFQLDQAVGGIPSEAGFRIAIDTDKGAIYKYSAGGVLVANIRSEVQGILNNIGFERVSPSLSVLGVLELRIVAGSTLDIYGTRGLVIMSRLDAIIDGTVRVDAGACDSAVRRSSCNGAGGGRGGGELGINATGCAPGGPGTNGMLDTGGAGGGMATSGGNGGTSGTAPGGTIAADLSTCAPESLVPLGGGGGGGHALGGNGGGGGGALQITSYGTLRLSSTAVVTAVGAGGQGTLFANGGGGGAGAGGALLLEAPTVEVLGAAVSTAGGGGGGGRVTGANGEAGRADGMPALGGVGDGSTSTDGLGGNGAINSVAALPGASNLAGMLDGTGGGGGGLGRIRINNLRGDAVDGARFVGRFSAGRTIRKPPAP